MNTITDDELVRVHNFEKEIVNLNSQIGQNTIDISILEERLIQLKEYQKDLISTYHSVYNQYSDYGNALSEKYKTDKIDSNTGEIR